MVIIIERSIPVAIGRMNTTLSLLNIMSPGSPKKENFGKSSKAQPIKIKINQRIRKNFAG